MGGWGGIEEPELEEGEAADDDTSIDPDIALSYIDEKLQNILGHFQKDFEGGVSAENLGAKFGGYGSFLPMYQRSPPTWSQPKTPPRVQNHSTSKSPGNLQAESGPQNVTVGLDAPVSQTRWTSASSNTHLLHNSKSSSGDGSVRQESCLVSEKVSAKHEPAFGKSVNMPDQKKITVRIKVGSDKAAQKNAALYSGLGLTSPSSSTGNSPEESCGTPFSSQEAPSESPASIIQVLTSFPVSEDLLLSPLHENLLNLIRSGKASVDSKPVAAIKGRQNNSVSSADNSALVLGTEEALKGKKLKSAGMGENVEQSKHENQMQSLDGKSSVSETMESRQSFLHDWNRKSSSDSAFDSGQSFKGAAGEPEVVRQPERSMPVKKREINKDGMKDRVLPNDLSKHDTLESLHVQYASKHDLQESRNSIVEKFGEHRVKSSQKGVLFDLKEDSRSKGNRIPASLRVDSDISESKLDFMEPMDHLKYKGGLKAASHERNESGVPNAKKIASKKLSSEGKKKLSSEGKKKLKGSQINGKPTSDLADSSPKSGVLAVKDKMSAQKDVNKVRNSYKDLLDTRLDHVDNQADPLARPSLDKSKDSSREGAAGKRGVADKNKESSGVKKFTNQLGFEMSVKEPLTDNISINGLMPGVEPVPLPPVLIEEDWVACDRCHTWRLLPPGRKPEQLPEKWLCSMLDWLPGMNRCDLSEDETTQAVRAKYQVLEPPNNLQSNAEIRHFDQVHQNVGSHDMTNQVKKKFKSKETFLTSNSSGPIMNSHLMKNPRQGVARSRSSKDMNQPHPEANLINKSNVKNLNKSYKAGEKHSNNGEENDITKGDGKPKKKIKRERVSDQHGQGSVKKIKTEVVMDMNNLCASESDGNLGKIGVSSSSGLPSKAVLKDKQKQLDQRESEKLKISLKKRRDSLQGSLDSGSIDVKTDGRGISTKKRKLKEDQDYLEPMQSNGNHFQDSKVSLKEDSGDSGFRREKKFKVLGSEGKGFGKTKGDDKSNKGGFETTMLLSGNRADTVDKNVKKAQQLRAKMASGLTLEDIEALKKDLGSEQLSTAATSSSSKVSDSRRSRANYQEVKGSPVESVSSSPMRTFTMNNHSPARIRGSRRDDSKFGEFPIVGSQRRSLYGEDIFESNQSSPCPSDVHATARRSSKARMSKNYHDHMLNQQKSGTVSSAQSNENDKASAFSFERIANKVSDLASEHEILHQENNLREETGIAENHLASRREVVGDSNHPISDESSHKAFRSDDNVSQRNSGKGIESGKWTDIRRQSQPKHGEHDRSDMKVGSLFSVDGRAKSSHNLRDSEAETANKSISNQVEARNGKLQVCSDDDNGQGFFPSGAKSTTESRRGNLLVVQPLDASAGGEGPKVLKTAGNGIHQNGTHGSMTHPAADQRVVQDLSGPSHTKKDAPTQSASSALNEAEKLRDCADRLKDSGFGFECNEAYFQAALMFLHGASLLESINSESNKHGEMNQMQIYSSTAKLCETCALEYEKRQEMAAAALAYKCMEVAYMRVVYCKNLSTNRVWHDLQASLQMAPQSESPSSSASDIDNLNNQVAADKAVLCKGNGSLAGNHIIAPRNRPNFVRLLDFMKDVNSAMEASRKSQSAFAAAANMMLEQMQNTEIIISVKRVIDFSFQDVEELVRMVRHAIGAISRGGFGGS